MTPTQLRLWIRKYGNVGVLMVAAYLGLRSLAMQRRRVLAVGVSVVVLGGTLLRPSANTPIKHSSLNHSASILAVPTPPAPTPMHEIVVLDTLVDSLVIHAEQDRWRLEIWRPSHHEDETGFSLDAREEYIKFFKNDQFIRASAKEEFGPGYTLDFGKPTFATRYPLVAIRVEPQCGHPACIDLLSIRNGRWVAIGQVGGEAGGPIFRDFDGDGKPEWIFDDYDWYTYYGANPKHLLVYKEARDGQLKLWKRVPNPKGQFLPPNLGLERW